jgi:hypothetical protein
MDARISNHSRADIMTIESAPRPTAAPVRVTFGQVLAAGASGLVQGAELAARSLPGSPMAVAAVRGPAAARTPAASPPLATIGGLSVNAAPEGPLAAGASTGIPTVGGLGSPSLGAAGTDPTGGIDASLQQSAQMNLYYLQVQQEIDSQNRSFTALSNVLKTEHDSAKAAIQNIHS